MYFCAHGCNPRLCCYCCWEHEPQQHKLGLWTVGSLPEYNGSIQSSWLENQTFYTNIFQSHKKYRVQDLQDKRLNTTADALARQAISDSAFQNLNWIFLLLWASCAPVQSFTSSTFCGLEQCTHTCSTLLLIVCCKKNNSRIVANVGDGATSLQGWMGKE